MAHTHPDSDARDGWPYSCISCGTTVYHDALHCGDCEQTAIASDGAADRPASTSFVGATRRWMKRQSYPSYVARVTAIAGLELSMTAAWLWALTLAPAWLSGALPV